MQPVGYLKAWPRIWTRDDREQIQQMARAGLERETPDCESDAMTTRPRCLPALLYEPLHTKIVIYRAKIAEKSKYYKAKLTYL